MAKQYVSWMNMVLLGVICQEMVAQKSYLSTCRGQTHLYVLNREDARIVLDSNLMILIDVVRVGCSLHLHG